MKTVLDRTDQDISPELGACSDRERAFISHYLLGQLEKQYSHGAAQEAAKFAGYGHKTSKPTTLAKSAQQVLNRPRVAAAIAAESLHLLRSHGPLLVQKLIEMIEDPTTSSTARIRAIAVGMEFVFPTRQEIDVRHHHVHEVDHTKAAIEALRWMLNMGVPRPKLIEQFGESGLPRYEKMLALEDQRVAEKAVDVTPPGAVAPMKTNILEGTP